MQTTYIRHKLNIHWRKVVVVLLDFWLLPNTVFSQQKIKENLLDYDEVWIHYGFLMGIHNSRYDIKFSETFTSPQMDSVLNIEPGKLGGFKLGFVVNMYMFQYLNFRMLPTVGFYEYDITYKYTDGTSLRALRDATMMELPMLFKYKSVRRGNVNMYLVGGINPSLEAAGKGDQVTQNDRLELKNFNLAMDLGAGFDLFFPLFKFSPEIRYSWGLRDMLPENQNEFSVNLSELKWSNIGFFISFEGSPNYLRRKRKKALSSP